MISKREGPLSRPFRGGAGPRDNTCARGSFAKADELLTFPCPLALSGSRLPLRKRRASPETQELSWYHQLGCEVAGRCMAPPVRARFSPVGLNLTEDQDQTTSLCDHYEGREKDHLIIFSKEDKDKITCTDHTIYTSLSWLLCVAATSLPIIAVVLL